MAKSVVKAIKIAIDVRPGLASPAQGAAWAALWRKLFSKNNEAPAPGGDNRGGDTEVSDDELKTPEPR